MKIYGTVKTESYLTIEDIDVGECFTFVDDGDLYILTEEEHVVRLADGSELCVDDCEGIPIKIVDAEIFIKEKCDNINENIYCGTGKIDELGRICISKIIYKNMNFEECDTVDIEINKKEGKMIIKKL